jgi:hypothetical protein
MLRRVDAGQSTLHRRTPGSRLPRWIIGKRAGKGQDAQPTHLPGLCPDLRTATSPMWNVTYRSWLTLSGVSVTESPTWRPACPLSHPTKPRRAGLLPAASHQVRNILSRQPKPQTIAIAIGNLGNVGLGDLLVSGGAICDPAHVLGVWVPRP